MIIIVQTTDGNASSLNGKTEISNKILDSIKIALLLNSIHKREFGALPISMPSGSLAELIIGCVVMFLTSYGMDQDLHIKTSTYGVRESTSSMGVLQERRLMIDHIEVIS